MDSNSAQPTDSEIIPFKSKKIRIFRSRALLPLIVVSAAVITFFHYIGRVKLDIYINSFAVMGVWLIFMSLYYYSGIKKPAFWYLFSAAFAGILLHYFLRFYDAIFFDVFRGRFPTETDSFISTFVNYSIIAGGREELLKATPALIALWLTLKYPKAITRPAVSLLDLFKNKFSKEDMLSGVVLRGPLDGLLMGCAAGAAFILLETLLQYVPEIIEKVLKASQAKGSIDSNDVALAYSVGLQLVIPRVLQGVTGHMAWAGIFGYFIGLVVVYPQALKKLIAIGYLIPVLLHGLWDSVSAAERSYKINPDIYLISISAATIVAFVAFLMKARQLSAVESFEQEDGSIVVSRSKRMEGKKLSRSDFEGNINEDRAPVVGRVSSKFGELTLKVGQESDLSNILKNVGEPDSLRFVVVRHPSDPNIYGIKNLSSMPWSAELKDGNSLLVEQGKNLIISNGTKIVVAGNELKVSEI